MTSGAYLDANARTFLNRLKDMNNLHILDQSYKKRNKQVSTDRNYSIPKY